MGNHICSRTNVRYDAADFVCKQTPSYIFPKKLDDEGAIFEESNLISSTPIKSAYILAQSRSSLEGMEKVIVQRLSVKGLYEILKQRVATDEEQHISVNHEHIQKRKARNIIPLGIEQINSGYYEAIQNGEVKYSKRILKDKNTEVEYIKESQGKDSFEIDRTEFSRDDSNLSARMNHSNRPSDCLLPTDIAINAVQEGKVSMKLCQFLEKRYSQVQNRISNISKVSRNSIDDFFINTSSQRNSYTKNRGSASLEDLVDDYHMPNNEESLVQYQEGVQNRLAVAYKESSGSLPKLNSQYKKPPLGTSYYDTSEIRKTPLGTESSVLRVSPVDNSTSVVEFETSLANLNRTRSDNSNVVQGILTRAPTKNKGPNGHLKNFGDESVETPLMTEENILEGEHFSFNNFPDSNKASGNFEGKELPYSAEELQQRQQEWANNLQELEVIEIVEEVEEENTSRSELTSRDEPCRAQTPEVCSKESMLSTSPLSFRKPADSCENEEAAMVKPELETEKKYYLRSYSVESGVEPSYHNFTREDRSTLEGSTVADFQPRFTEKGLENKRITLSEETPFARCFGSTETTEFIFTSKAPEMDKSDQGLAGMLSEEVEELAVSEGKDCDVEVEQSGESDKDDNNFQEEEVYGEEEPDGEEDQPEETEFEENQEEENQSEERGELRGEENLAVMQPQEEELAEEYEIEEYEEPEAQAQQEEAQEIEEAEEEEQQEEAEELYEEFIEEEEEEAQVDGLDEENQENEEQAHEIDAQEEGEEGQESAEEGEREEGQESADEEESQYEEEMEDEDVEYEEVEIAGSNDKGRPQSRGEEPREDNILTKEPNEI